MVFVDTGAFLARYLERDANHPEAVRLWKRLAGVPLYTSSHVFDETVTLLGRRAGYDFAATRGERILASGAMEVLPDTKEDVAGALRLFRKYSDQEVSFTDCLSFVLMKRLGITTAFTFDRHFALAGFQILAAAR